MTCENLKLHEMHFFKPLNIHLQALWTAFRIYIWDNSSYYQCHEWYQPFRVYLIL